MSQFQKISVREKMAYGLGDTASNFVFQTVMIFQLYFYTEIFGLSPAVVGTLFLVVRIFDAVTDPLMGAFTDHVNTKHGKYRPFILWLAVPFGLITVLAFTTPDFSESNKMIYAFVTYTLLMTMYTAVNIPYSALGGVLTANPKERVSIQTYRFFFGMLGGFIVTVSTLPLIKYFGQGNEAMGYQYTMIAMSIVGVVLFILCFLGTKERVHPPKSQQSSIKDDLKALVQNDQWRVLSGIAVMVLVGIVIKMALAALYAEKVLGLSTEMVTLFITIGMIGNIAGVSLADIVSKKMCKIKAYRYIQVLAAIICAGAYFIPPEHTYVIFAAFFLWCFTLQIGTPILWAKMADVVDYGHFKTGIRVNATVYSTIIFFIKVGIALGGAIAAWLLAYYGYNSDVAVTDEIKQGITLSFTVFPALAFLVVAYLTRFYNLTDAKIQDIQGKITVEQVE